MTPWSTHSQNLGISLVIPLLSSLGELLDIGLRLVLLRWVPALFAHKKAEWAHSVDLSPPSEIANVQSFSMPGNHWNHPKLVSNWRDTLYVFLGFSRSNSPMKVTSRARYDTADGVVETRLPKATTWVAACHIGHILLVGNGSSFVLTMKLL
jgi:hypothetical protein